MGIFRCRPNLSNAPEIRSVFFFSIVKLHDFHQMKRTDLLSITGTASKADRLLITIVTAIIEALDLTGYLVAASSLSIPLNYLAISLSLFFCFSSRGPTQFWHSKNSATWDTLPRSRHSVSSPTPTGSWSGAFVVFSPRPSENVLKSDATLSINPPRPENPPFPFPPAERLSLIPFKNGNRRKEAHPDDGPVYGHAEVPAR